MAENKTVATDSNVIDFVSGLDDPRQRSDSEKLITMMSDISGSTPVMWGSSIVGFGTLQYKTSDGKMHDWMQIGFSPRKGKLSLYVTVDAAKYTEQLDAMGKYEIGKGCIYVKRLDDVDTAKLKAIIEQAYKDGPGLQQA